MQVTDDDIRLQLEGRVEVLEDARRTLRHLEERLSGWRWRRRLREEPLTLPQTLAALPRVNEALERVRHRAQLSGWPDPVSALRLSREVEASLERVSALARRRLSALKRSDDAGDLGSVLSRLHALALAPIPLPPSSDEERLLEGRLGEASVFSLWPFVIYAPTFLGLALGMPPWVMLAYAAVGALLLGAFLRSGRFWLTTRRLVWKPLLGEPVAVPLSSIADHGVKLSRARSTLWVRGEQDVAIRFAESTSTLAALLEVRRRPPLLDAGTQPRTLEAACYAGWRERPGGKRERGAVILRPGYAAFIPEEAGAATLGALRQDRNPPDVPVPPELLFLHLRCLPEDAFDDAVRRSVLLVNGSLLERGRAKHDPRSPAERDIVLSDGALSFHGSVDWRQFEVVDRMLRRWNA